MLFQRVVDEQLLQHFRLTRLPDFTGQKHLIHDRVHLVEVEHEVQLAHVVEVLVQDLHKVVDRFQIRQIVVTHVHTDAKIEASIPSIHDFEISELECTMLVPVTGHRNAHLNKIGVLCIADSYDCMHLFNQLLFLIVIEVHVPFGQSGLSSTVLNQDEADLKGQRR